MNVCGYLRAGRCDSTLVVVQIIEIERQPSLQLGGIQPVKLGLKWDTAGLFGDGAELDPELGLEGADIDRSSVRHLLEVPAPDATVPEVVPHRPTGDQLPPRASARTPPFYHKRRPLWGWVSLDQRRFWLATVGVSLVRLGGNPLPGMVYAATLHSTGPETGWTADKRDGTIARNVPSLAQAMQQPGAAPDRASRSLLEWAELFSNGRPQIVRRHSTRGAVLTARPRKWKQGSLENPVREDCTAREL